MHLVECGPSDRGGGGSGSSGVVFLVVDVEERLTEGVRAGACGSVGGRVVDPVRGLGTGVREGPDGVFAGPVSAVWGGEAVPGARVRVPSAVRLLATRAARVLP